MERGKTTSFILKQFKRKTKRVLKKDEFSEFFYFNKDRKVIEFLSHDDTLSIENFFKAFLPVEFRDFVSVKIMNDHEEKISTWYYNDEDLVVILSVNWGVRKQEISVDVSIDNFVVTSIGEDGTVARDIDYILFNDYIISFFTIQARNLAKTFEKISKQ
ncbi:MAG: hypothetical protein KC589_01550 [Nanoarchaeota archaeon]|nr:hypothetical protein [Nanoarchaeota archaeon]